MTDNDKERKTQEATYHIQSLVHEAMVDGTFSRCGRILGLIITAIVDVLRSLGFADGWWQRELVLAVFLGLLVANSAILSSVCGVCEVTIVAAGGLQQ